MPFSQRERDLRLASCRRRKTRLARVAAGGQHARQLAARDDVEAGAETREQRQDREVGVRLDRVADQRVAPGERGANSRYARSIAARE